MGILSQSSWYGEKSSTGQHQRELLISVIVPIYKVEAYLDRCVQSIVDQTYANLEILLVDDGSPDRCPEICDAWSQRDPRIRVIHKKNGGLSDARNVGIDAAKGDWLAFVDSDDYIMPQIHAANRIVWLPDDLYACVQRDGSIMANYGVRNLRDTIACAKDSFSWSENVAPQWRKAVEYDAFRNYLGTVHVCHQKLERQDYEELLHEWESFLQTHIHAYFRNTKDRVKYILYRLHFFFFIQAFHQKCFPQQ